MSCGCLIFVCFIDGWTPSDVHDKRDDPRRQTNVTALALDRLRMIKRKGHCRGNDSTRHALLWVSGKW